MHKVHMQVQSNVEALQSKDSLIIRLNCYFILILFSIWIAEKTNMWAVIQLSGARLAKRHSSNIINSFFCVHVSTITMVQMQVTGCSRPFWQICCLLEEVEQEIHVFTFLFFHESLCKLQQSSVHVWQQDPFATPVVSVSRRLPAGWLKSLTFD